MIKIFANIIRKILEDYDADGKKVTQVELAKVLNTTRQSFSNKMARDTFTVNDLVKIADYLGMQVILKGKNEYILKKED